MELNVRRDTEYVVLTLRHCCILYQIYSILFFFPPTGSVHLLRKYKMLHSRYWASTFEKHEELGFKVLKI